MLQSQGVVHNTTCLPHKIGGSQNQKLKFRHVIFGGCKAAARHPRLLQGTQGVCIRDVRVCTHIFVCECRKTAVLSPCTDRALYCKAAARTL